MVVHSRVVSQEGAPRLVDRWTGRAVAWTFAVMAAIAVITAYPNLYELFRMAGETTLNSILEPLMVFLLAVVAVSARLEATQTGSRCPVLAWVALFIAIAAVSAANIWHGAAHGVAAMAIDEMPVTLTLVAAGIVTERASLSRRHPAAKTVPTVPASAGAVTHPGQPHRRSRAMCHTGRTAVYRLYDKDGALLYVGITCNLNQRFRQHARHKPWWPQVARKETEWHPARDAAARAELTAINAENPAYNIAGKVTAK